MRAVLAAIDTGSRTLSYFLGSLVIALFVAVMATSLEAGDIAAWARQVFGITFLALLAGLVLIALFSWIRVHRDDLGSAHREVWLEAGLHAAGGVATLALSYTLLGISLGIGSLAGQSLGPDTIQGVIRDLTDHFSMAFLTTVVGLPTSALLRALLMVTNRRIEARAGRAATSYRGGKP